MLLPVGGKGVQVAVTKILIVDDDQGSRDLLSEVLASNGYVVAAVEDGSAARDELARNGGYDIVIADLRMPNGSGLDLFRDLRRRNQPERFILMSSFMTGSERQQALELGACALLDKPFRLTQLLDAVSDVAVRKSMSITH
ncbi:MAG TPA: response regulator [Terriglobia bacterium]|nr:response regulator [Terriglobia bacterium]